MRSQALRNRLASGLKPLNVWLGQRGSPFGESIQNGEEAFQGVEMDRAERVAVDREGGFGEQRADVVKEVASLYSTIQISVHCPDKSWLVTEVK